MISTYELFESKKIRKKNKSKNNNYKKDKLKDEVNNLNLNCYKNNIYPGLKVKIVEKQNQGSNNYTVGKVKLILTKKAYHPRGIKVQLESGQVGRVVEIL